MRQGLSPLAKIIWLAIALAGAVSLPRAVEDGSHSLRRRYLRWIREVGQSKIRGRRLVDRLQVRPGLSMWWMTGMAEKCNLDRSPHVNQAILLLAFAEWMRGRKEKEIRLVTDDLSLVNCLGAWGQDHGISCVREKAPIPGFRKEDSGGSGLQYFRQLRALFFLARKVWARKALRGVGLPEWRSARGSLTFVTYLFNHARGGRGEGFLESPYWGELPRVLQKKGIKSNWLHLYVEDSRLPTAKDAARLLGSFKKHGSGIQTHASLDSFISLTVLWRTLRDWWCLQRTSRG